MARIAQLNVSQGGVPKRPIPEAHVGPLGLEGDRVAHPQFHGGPERAVCLYAMERIDALRAQGHPVFPGALGENVTVEGVAWAEVGVGDRFIAGDVALEVTRFTTPCATTAPAVSGRMDLILQAASPGWSRVYARVLRAGRLAAGMPIVHMRRSDVR